MIMEYEPVEDADELEEHPEDPLVERLQKLLDDPKTRGEALNGKGFIVGRNLLHIACERGAMKTLLLLLENGGSNLVNVPDKYRDTPLHIAAAKNQAEVVDELLMSGADILALNKHGKTPCKVTPIPKCTQPPRNSTLASLAPRSI
jgi:ankyrin repeat protein